MLNKKCYGILEDPDLIYTEMAYENLEICIKELLASGANSFMIGDIGDFNNRAYQICKSLQNNVQNEFKIKIVSTDNFYT